MKHLAFDHEGERLVIVYESDQVSNLGFENSESNDLDETGQRHFGGVSGRREVDLGEPKVAWWSGKATRRSRIESKIGRVTSFAINESIKNRRGNA